MQKCISVLLLLHVVFLSACDSAPPGEGGNPQPSPPKSSRTTATALPPVGATPASGGKETAGTGTTPGVEIPQRKPLDLSFDQLPTEQGQRTGSVTATEADRLLPDLFVPKRNENPLSVEGRLLIERDAREFADTVDGAAINIEIKTD